MREFSYKACERRRLRKKRATPLTTETVPLLLNIGKFLHVEKGIFRSESTAGLETMNVQGHNLACIRTSKEMAGLLFIKTIGL